MRLMILDLTRQVTELRVTVDFLRMENDKLVKKPPRTKVTK
jgi:hypothetical protein